MCTVALTIQDLTFKHDISWSFVFNNYTWQVIVHFVDIVKIVDHDFLNIRRHDVG
jgi:hypothetical protein